MDDPKELVVFGHRVARAPEEKKPIAYLNFNYLVDPFLRIRLPFYCDAAGNTHFPGWNNQGRMGSLNNF